MYAKPKKNGRRKSINIFLIGKFIFKETYSYVTTDK